MSTFLPKKYKTQLPCFIRTEMCAPEDKSATKISLIESGKKNFSYFCRPFILDEDNERQSEFNLFPIALNPDGSPWILANIYILHFLEKGRQVTSLASVAEDLGAFNFWLYDFDDPDELLTHFPAIALSRVSYRYHAHLINQIYSRNLDSDTASRRMLAVLNFYRWLEQSKFFTPRNPICEEKDLTIQFQNRYGFHGYKSLASSDLMIASPEAIDPFDGTIKDQGKLRPLSTLEQNWIFESARKLANTEVYLLMLIMISTGARVQTACTLRRKHVENPNPKVSKSVVDGREVVKIKAGPGTGIDTKFDKAGLLMIPKEVYDLLHIYSISKRANHRSELTKTGAHPDQYLFLTNRGEAYFESKERTNSFDPDLKRRHFKRGGTVRQFVKDTLIPFIRSVHDPKFHFRIHDLRATYGMNTESILVNRVYKKEMSMDKARQILKELMWHKSVETTDLYLNFRALSNSASNAVNDLGSQVQIWIEDAMKGLENENR